MALTDALGIRVSFRLLPGQRSELIAVSALIKELKTGHLLADKAYDADWLRIKLSKRKIKAVIPAKKNRNFPRPYVPEIYKRRLPERFLVNLLS